MGDANNAFVTFYDSLDTRNTTVKRLAALKTFPTTIEDNSSQNKEENLTNACFDQVWFLTTN